MAMSDSKATLRTVKRVQFGILSPDEIVSISNRPRSYCIGLCFGVKMCEINEYFSAVCPSPRVVSSTRKQWKVVDQSSAV